MLLIAWILIGLTYGYLAHKTMNKSGGGFFRDLGLGIAGALGGGAVISFVFGATDLASFNMWTMFVAILGSILLLLLYHRVLKQRTA